jgi:hypothetical protein
MEMRIKIIMRHHFMFSNMTIIAKQKVVGGIICKASIPDC